MSAELAPSSERAYVPVWEGVVEGWVRNTIKSSAWKVEATMSPEDLYQEAYLVYARCVEKADPLENARHFFGFYRTSFLNRITDIARVQGARSAKLRPPLGRAAERYQESHHHYGDEDESRALSVAPETAEAAARLNELVAEAPVEFRGLLRAALGGELPESKMVNGVRQSRNARLAEAAGVAPEAVPGLMDKIEVWARKFLTK